MRDWMDGTGRVTLSIREEDIDAVPRSGPCDDAIDAMLPRYAGQMEGHEDAIRAALGEYGAWEAEELADDAENRARILWIAIGDIREEPTA